MKNLIEQAKKVQAFIKPATMEEIQSAEQKLHMVFSDEYRSYLENFGILSFNSHEIYGLGVPETSYLNIIEVAKDFAELNPLPKNCVALQDIMDGVYDIYNNKTKEILVWHSIHNEILEKLPKTLEQYLFDILAEN